MLTLRRQHSMFDTVPVLTTHANTRPHTGQLVSLDCSLPEDLSISPASARTILAVLAPLYSYVIAIIIFVFFDIGSFVWKK